MRLESWAHFKYPALWNVHIVCFSYLSCMDGHEQNVAKAELFHVRFGRLGDAGAMLQSPSSSPFALALNAANVVLVVPNRHKSVYTRLWCAYEAYLSQEAGKPILIARSRDWKRGHLDVWLLYHWKPENVDMFGLWSFDIPTHHALRHIPTHHTFLTAQALICPLCTSLQSSGCLKCISRQRSEMNAGHLLRQDLWPLWSTWALPLPLDVCLDCLHVCMTGTPTDMCGCWLYLPCFLPSNVARCLAGPNFLFFSSYEIYDELGWFSGVAKTK